MKESLKNDVNNIVWWIPLKKLRNSVRNVMFENLKINDNKNNNVLCPICGWSGDEFNSVGGYKNIKCPKCLSYNRHRLYYFYLLNKINANKTLNICHFAPEKSIEYTFNLFKNINYINCDIDPAKAMCSQNITNTTFENNYFDIIFCSHVLEHIEDDIKAMKELKRILKPDGFAILQVPYFSEWNGKKLETTFEDFSIKYPKEREKIFGQDDHVRVYEKNDYVKRLIKAGFNVYEDNFYYTLSDDTIKKYALRPEIIFYCTKN